jgi:hypothetical protein
MVGPPSDTEGFTKEPLGRVTVHSLNEPGAAFGNGLLSA